jgi:uncharacterized membrane protein YjjB (DUF3815 family)
MHVIDEELAKEKQEKQVSTFFASFCIGVHATLLIRNYQPIWSW